MSENTVHNTHTFTKHEQGYKCESHNFPEFVGEGESEEDARDNMNRKIMYYADNYPEHFKQRLKNRIAKGLACECGHPLDGSPLIIYRGR